MKYIDWRDELERFLCGVSEDERKRVLDYYSEIYADKRDAGLSEDEAVAQFGAPYDAARKILDEEPTEDKQKESSADRKENDAKEESQVLTFISEGSVDCIKLKCAVGRAYMRFWDGDKVKVEYPATSLLAYSVEQKGGSISIKCKANIKTFSLKSKKVPDIIIEMPRGLTADCEFEVSAGTLCLESGEYGNITGEINAGCADMREITCSDMRLNLDAGALTAGSIICHRFESEVNAGKAEIAQVCASDAKLSVNAGKATVNSFDCRRTSVDVSAGAASITMSGKKEDYDIDITKTLGSCNIKSSQSPVDRSLTARVSFGSLSVSFSK